VSKVFWDSCTKGIELVKVRKYNGLLKKIPQEAGLLKALNLNN
jgi:hypothetical protein